MKNYEMLKTGVFASATGHTPGAPVNRFLTQIILARATELARIGRYHEAESLLGEGIREDGENLAILDLYARVCAQQGRLSEAETFWNRASRIDPRNEEYRAGLQRIASMQSRPTRLFFSPVLVAVFAFLLMVFSVFAMRGYFIGLRDSVLSTVRTEMAGITTGMQEDYRKEIVPPVVKITVPGVSLKTENNRLVVSFNSGLFDRGINLTPESSALLTSLGHQLEPYAQHISVHVVGHTNNVPMPSNHKYSDNVSLGMKRAMIVVEHLLSNKMLPLARN